jgi:hypothetical protein
MNITLENTNRILYINDYKINVNDGEIVKYNGNYYRNTKDIMNMQIIETQFIGIIECHKSHYEMGIYGLYIKPIFIYSNTKNKWLKITNYHQPDHKYFYYPHLLILPETTYNFYPIYNLHTCQNIVLDDFLLNENINEILDLNLEQEL